MLDEVAPTFIRDSLPETAPEGDAVYLIVDLVAATPEYDFTSVYDGVSLQISAWGYMADALDTMEAVRKKLEPEQWQLTNIITMVDDGVRGVIGTFTNETAY